MKPIIEDSVECKCELSVLMLTKAISPCLKELSLSTSATEILKLALNLENKLRRTERLSFSEKESTISNLTVHSPILITELLSRPPY
jgi:hypothetical protein